MDIVDRIFELVDAQYQEQREFAMEIGVDASHISRWRNRKTSSYQRRLPQIADALGTTTEYLLTGEGRKKKTAVSGGNWVPVLGDVAAGIPIEAVQDIVDYEEIDAALAATGDFFGLRIKGASMEPRIREGDVVIVRKQEDADTGDTAVVMVNGDSATVKRIKKDQDGGLWLLPNNPAYDPQHFSPAEIANTPVRIIGRVVELRGKF